VTDAQPDEVRVVLLKPGDVLAIGNVGQDVSEADAEAMSRFLDAVGLRAVWVFPGDITLDVIHAATPGAAERET
jgi:hypothetical protein